MKSYKRYPCQVKLIRKFVSGHLKNMTYGENMGFMSRKDAITWAQSVSESPRVNYKVVSMTDIETEEFLYGS